MTNSYVLSGDLKFISLGDLLQLLSTDSRTGELRIISTTQRKPAKIYISDGNPVDAEAGELKGKDAIYSLFGWLDSRFEFYSHKITKPDIVKQRMMALILDALRELDEGLIEKVVSDPSLNNSPDVDNAESLGEGTVIRGPSVEYASVVAEDEFGKGDVIVQEGRHGNWLWVILEGVVDIVKDAGGSNIKISSSGTGAFVGGLSTLLNAENNRSATAIARDTVQLGVIDAQQLGSELGSINPGFKKLLMSLDNRLRSISDRVAAIRSGADKAAGVPKNVQPMIRQGDEVQKVFTILQGSAYIVRKTSSGIVYLMTLQKGDFIGNIPFLGFDHEPLNAGVFASPDLKLAIVDIDAYQLEYDRLSVTMKNIIDYTSVCISATTSLACI